MMRSRFQTPIGQGGLLISPSFVGCGTGRRWTASLPSAAPTQSTTTTSTLFVGFPRTTASTLSPPIAPTHPFTAASGNMATVDANALQKAISKVFSGGANTPTKGADEGTAASSRIALLKTALLRVRSNPQYAAAKAWEAKALLASHKYPFRVLWCVFAALLFQNVITAYWVFVAFDWNLVEPCTYFFGYTSLTWFGLMFYKYTGREFTYDALIGELQQRKFRKLTASSSPFGKSGGAYESVLAEFRHKEEVLQQELEALGVEVSTVDEKKESE